MIEKNLLSGVSWHTTDPRLLELNTNAGNGHPPGPAGNSVLIRDCELANTEIVPAYRSILFTREDISATNLAVLYISSIFGSMTKIKSEGVSHGELRSKLPDGRFVHKAKTENMN